MVQVPAWDIIVHALSADGQSYRIRGSYSMLILNTLLRNVVQELARRSFLIGVTALSLEAMIRGTTQGMGKNWYGNPLPHHMR